MGKIFKSNRNSVIDTHLKRIWLNASPQFFEWHILFWYSYLTHHILYKDSSHFLDAIKVLTSIGSLKHCLWHPRPMPNLSRTIPKYLHWENKQDQTIDYSTIHFKRNLGNYWPSATAPVHTPAHNSQCGRVELWDTSLDPF